MPYGNGFWHFVKATEFALWPIISGLTAAVTVHVLTQSRERERWLLDSKKQEFKELLTALADSYVTIISLYTPGIRTMDAEDGQKLTTSQFNLARVSRDRLFIVEDLQLAELLREWYVIFESYSTNRDEGKFYTGYLAISSQILKAASQSLPKSPLQKLKFWKN